MVEDEVETPVYAPHFDTGERGCRSLEGFAVPCCPINLEGGRLGWRPGFTLLAVIGPSCGWRPSIGVMPVDSHAGQLPSCSQTIFAPCERLQEPQSLLFSLHMGFSFGTSAGQLHTSRSLMMNSLS